MAKIKYVEMKHCPRCDSQLNYQDNRVWCNFLGNPKEEIKPCFFGRDKLVTLIDLMRGTVT